MAVPKHTVDRQIEAIGEFSKWFTKKERNYLHEVMAPGETIHGMTSGLLDGNTWLITVTDRRVLFLDKGMIYGLKQLDLPLSHISAVSHRTGMIFGKIEVSTAGGTKLIDMVERRDVAKIAQMISDLQSRPKEPQPASCAPTQPPILDPLAQLERLAALRAQGVLTDSEFATQKAKILGTAPASLAPPPLPPTAAPTETATTVPCPMCQKPLLLSSIKIGDNHCPHCKGKFVAQQ